MQVLANLVVSEDNRTWFLTCMGFEHGHRVGDAVTDKPTKVVRTAPRSPYGIRTA